MPVLIGIAVVVLAAGAFVFAKMRGSKPEPAPAVETAGQTIPERKPRERRTQVAEEPTESAAPAAVAVTAPSSPAPRPAAPIAPIVPAGPPPSAETRRLVSDLANLDLKTTPLTPELAAAFKNNLQQLVQNGAASVPAITEFLALNKDVAFDGTPGAADALGFSSLRLSLLEALGAIGGPESIALSAQTLQSTTDPREIALLASSLERQAPEQYREAALAAARNALAAAASGQLPGKDVGPLFNVMAQFGGANAIADLQGAAGGQWRYYATIALANLPDGAGVGPLAQMLDPKNPSGGSRLAAMQVLGQMAADNPEARNALLAQASTGTIPAGTWINIAASLGGDKFAIGTISAQNNPNVRTWHLNYGNQNYYSQPQPLTPEQVQQRIGVIDQFIAANPGEAAVSLLQQTRGRLQGRLGTATAPGQ